MSYSLIILDLDEIPELPALLETLEGPAESRTGDTGPPALTGNLASFLGDVRNTFPSLEDDPDNSPWSITPSGLPQLDGRALEFAVANGDRLFDVFMEFEELAWRYDLIICDPQEGTLRRPRHE